MRPTVSETLTEWRPVLGHEGSYEVSSTGRVRSLDRRINGQMFRGRELAQLRGSSGYKYVRIYRDSNSKHCTVHALVAEAFIGPRPEGMVVRHLDGNQDNNVPTNLCWGTVSENQLDMVRHGTHRNASKVRCIRGHLLAGGNLKVCMRNGKVKQRLCVSCKKSVDFARYCGRRGDEAFIAERADAIYASFDVEPLGGVE